MDRIITVCIYHKHQHYTSSVLELLLAVQLSHWLVVFHFFSQNKRSLEESLKQTETKVAQVIWTIRHQLDQKFQGMQTDLGNSWFLFPSLGRAFRVMSWNIINFSLLFLTWINVCIVFIRYPIRMEVSYKTLKKSWVRYALEWICFPSSVSFQVPETCRKCVYISCPSPPLCKTQYRTLWTPAVWPPTNAVQWHKLPLSTSV